jgi:protein-S-isoprenylcysteine O-methyltransferase Ste14
MQTRFSDVRFTPELKAGILRRVFQILVSFLLMAGVLFVSAGDLGWTWAWVYLGVYLLGVAINAAFMLRTGLEIAARRSETKGMKTWDRWISAGWGISQYLLIPLVAGLDWRFGWAGRYPMGVQLTGTAIFAIGFALFSWAMLTNAFFASVVRVQTELGHRVCTSGPYRFVRHPGYVGAILQSIGIPLLLGSNWALLPGVIAVGFMVARTAFEDRTLQAELPGYVDYADKVRYRLLPGLW